MCYCLCCGSGRVSITVHAPKTAFAVGERIDFITTVKNVSKRNVKCMKVEFKKKIRYTTDAFHTNPSRARQDEEVIVSFVEKGRVRPSEERIFYPHFIVPEDLQVPNFSNCRLFESIFLLKFTCILARCSVNVGVTIYPKIGHIQYKYNEKNDQTTGLKTSLHRENNQLPELENKVSVCSYPSSE